MAIVMEQVKELLGTKLDIQPFDIQDTDRLFETLGIDSVAVITLLLDLERVCHVAFDMEELSPEHLATVGSLSTYIEQLQADA
ncbi:acyl carrier protein [Paenibacillus massiliensis]|uniref:acyl carrier protein n=1 Tax=Paenibacillus massiliensis TaxID=225917 RepID=UPI0004706617|nr:acyl carrier protein [Paenibacillus massiliensis]